LAIVQLRWQALPVSTQVWHRTLDEGQLVGQAPGWPAAMAVSQSSPASTMPLPQAGPAQSGSVAEVQPEGQQPSPGEQVVMVVWVQWAVQVAALPSSVSVVQALPSLQLVGQVAGGSQVSPVSSTPLPHTATGQSGSVALVQPEGQQPSLTVEQAVMGV
jgi:hypothetical protein